MCAEVGEVGFVNFSEVPNLENRLGCFGFFFQVLRAMEGSITPVLRSHELGYTRAAFLKDFQLNAIQTPGS